MSVSSPSAPTLVLTSLPLFRLIMTYIDGIPGRVLSSLSSLQHGDRGFPWSATGILPRDAIQRGDFETLRHLYRLSTTQAYKTRPELSFEGTICYAIQFGRLEMVQYLVKTIQDDQKDKTALVRDRIKGSTLLAWAIRYSEVFNSETKVEIVEWVANHYSDLALKDVNADDLSHAGLLLMAFLKERGLATNGFKDPHLVDLVAARGQLGTLRFLLENGDEEQRCTSDAMDKAAANGHLEIVTYLHEQRREGCTVAAIDNAARNGFLEVVRFLHAQRTEGCTIAAMDGAARNGHFDIVQFLHTNRSEGCSTAAMDGAAAGGFLHIVQFLHNHRHEGCTTNAMNGAAQSGHLDVVRFLHDYRTEGCTIDAMDGAALMGNLMVVKFLHDNRQEGCSVRAIDGAAWRGHVEVVQFLVAKRSEGCTSSALDAACQNGHLEIVRVLHEEANATCTTKAMDNAASNGYLDIVRYLQENRVEGCTKDAMTNAAIHGHVSVVQYLGEHRHEGSHEYALERVAVQGNVQCVDALIRSCVHGCLFDARRAALEAGKARVAVFLSAWINPDVKTCSFRQYHINVGPRWCQKQPQSEEVYSVSKQTRNVSITSSVVNLLKWFRRL